ncbi:MAG: molybdopterin-binding protein, partial [Gammaproteobacteria bacterium]|nr:molybdopterin-binding protein [Gammaproteobacteria bacterium]
DRHDVVILTGGVSMGKYDFVPGVLERLGVELVFHRIEQRPGRPMWFGVSLAARPVFALPGNPVSTLVCLIRYVVPALWKAMGADPETEEWVQLAREVKFPADLAYFLPVTLRANAHGSPQAEPRPTNTSGDYAALGGTDGFVELPRGAAVFPEGTSTRLFRW